MSRIKGIYVAQMIIDIDMSYNEQDYGSIAEVKKRFRTMLTPMIQEELQSQISGDGKVTVHEEFNEIYEVTE